MYNGIGLSTPRGSGTSGHVVKNVSSLRPGKRDGLSKRRDYSRGRDSKTKPLDKGIIDHERKRQVEVQCLELQDRLEDRGVDEAEIEDRVNELRSRLLQNLEHIEFTDAKQIKPFETQKIAEAKAKENRRMARALRIEEDYAEGASFDRELQELRRQKRMLERERDRELAEEREHQRRSLEHLNDRRHSRSRSPQGRNRDSDRYYRSRRRYSRERSRSKGSSRDRSLSSDRSREPAEDTTQPQPAPEREIRPVEDGEPGEIEDVEPLQRQQPADSPAEEN
ncbi:RNA-splicing factor [Coemansia sp. RSA 989]|nr:cwf21 domain-containing protein [Coemansia mojavensis]KAJ1742608.1 RNA-splicing factor [Coemansia sp. RSA 1086]KAJ1751741.1 RNA-splicing factor [Coemansia sp. RSA 1821]KAJ1868435.1 RNA-splicing factor [Coemansia sp. RSA 989]KAJ1875133.1 RNA-splicing factor [Coemansia sp. RSA 990]